jgi:hypothetical protein
MAKPNQAPNNPFACASNAVKMHTVGPCCGQLLAVYGYEVKDGGGSIEFTPLTGNLSADLKYYRWSVVDQYGQSVGVSLDLSNPSTAVTVNTSTLAVNGPFTVKFAACKAVGVEEQSVSYNTVINDVTSNPSGNSTPVNYENVAMLLKLTSTDDANFSLFPVDGLEISSKQVIDLTDYLDGSPTMGGGKSYIFSLEAKKYWYEPTADEPSFPTNDVVASATAEPSYPIALGVDYAQILSAITIETGSAGAFAEIVTTALNAEGVQPSFIFTLKTNIA